MASPFLEEGCLQALMQEGRREGNPHVSARRREARRAHDASKSDGPRADGERGVRWGTGETAQERRPERQA